MALGNAMVVVTEDGQVPFLKRSNAVADSQGTYALPGGHPEPSKLGLAAISDLKTFTPSESSVREELYDSIIRETEEELGVARAYLDINAMRMLGVAQRRVDHRPQLVGCIKCTLSSAELLQKWRKNKDESQIESEALVFISISGLANVLDSGCVHGVNVGSEHLGALQLYLESKNTIRKK